MAQFLNLIKIELLKRVLHDFLIKFLESNRLIIFNLTFFDIFSPLFKCVKNIKNNVMQFNLPKCSRRRDGRETQNLKSHQLLKKSDA